MLDAKYFNKIKTVNGKKVIQNPDNILALVNKNYILGDYKPKDLVRPNVRFSFGDERIEKSYMRKEAAAALEKMFAAAEKDGIELYAASAYRSYNRQKAVYAAEVQSSGKNMQNRRLPSRGRANIRPVSPLILQARPPISFSHSKWGSRRKASGLQNMHMNTGLF